MNSFLLHILNWFLSPGFLFSLLDAQVSPVLKKASIWPPPFKLLSHFPSSFHCQKLCASIASWLILSLFLCHLALSKPNPSSHGCVYGHHPSPNSKHFSWFLSSSSSLQWSALLTVIGSEESSPVSAWVQVRCAAAPPLWPLSNALIGSISFYSSAVGTEGGSLQNLFICLCTLTLGSPFCLMPYHYFSKYRSSIVLWTHLSRLIMHHACRHSVFWPCCLSSSFLKALWPNTDICYCC